MKMNKRQLAVLIAACFVTVLLRVREMPVRLDSMIALTLLCGAVVRHPAAIVLPLGIRLFTDILLWYQTGYGFYSSMLFDYSAYLIIALFARSSPFPHYITMVGGGLLGPCLFFVVSNLGVWFMWPETYPATLAGLTNCYMQGLPFLRSSLAGNVPFTLIFLAGWHVATVSATAGSFPIANTIDRGNDV